MTIDSRALIPAILIAALLPGVGRGAELVAQGSARLENADEPRSIFGLDPRVIELSSDGQRLTVAIELDRDVVPYLREEMAQGVAQVLFDADNDASTGGESFGSGDSGYEFLSTIYACKEFEDGRVCAGDVGEGVEVTGYIGEFEPEAWNPESRYFEPVHGFTWDGGDAVIDGRSVRASIAYEDFGGAPGKTLRIVVLAGSGRPINVPPVILTLK